MNAKLPERTKFISHPLFYLKLSLKLRKIDIIDDNEIRDKIVPAN